MSESSRERQLKAHDKYFKNVPNYFLLSAPDFHLSSKITMFRDACRKQHFCSGKKDSIKLEICESENR